MGQVVFLVKLRLGSELDHPACSPSDIINYTLNCSPSLAKYILNNDIPLLRVVKHILSPGAIVVFLRSNWQLSRLCRAPTCLFERCQASTAHNSEFVAFFFISTPPFFSPSSPSLFLSSCPADSELVSSSSIRF